MPCFKPIEAWRSSERTSNGKNRIVFKKSGTVISLPFKLPCGRCIGCKLERSQIWAIRCVHESQLHFQNSFITLTYAPEHLPQDGSLIKWHFQDFMKRLRGHFHPKQIRYFMAGEYGTNFTRPHYHACLFGLDFPDKSPIRETEGIILYNSPQLDSIWGKGFTSIGDVNFETAAYTARYITKKISGELADDHYQTTCEITGKTIDLEREYTAMSLKPGIANEWYEKYKNEVYPSDYLIYKGRKISVPRYYDKIYEIQGGDIEAIKKTRKIAAVARASDATPERLLVREKVTLLKMQQQTRSYEQNES